MNETTSNAPAETIPKGLNSFLKMQLGFLDWGALFCAGVAYFLAPKAALVIAIALALVCAALNMLLIGLAVANMALATPGIPNMRKPTALDLAFDVALTSLLLLQDNMAATIAATAYALTNGIRYFVAVSMRAYVTGRELEKKHRELTERVAERQEAAHVFSHAAAEDWPDYQPQAGEAVAVYIYYRELMPNAIGGTTMGPLTLVPPHHYTLKAGVLFALQSYLLEPSQVILEVKLGDKIIVKMRAIVLDGTDGGVFTEHIDFLHDREEKLTLGTWRMDDGEKWPFPDEDWPEHLGPDKP